MRVFAVGQHATGVIAIGQQATGVVAIGQLATGVIAIGQLARGVLVIGQVGVGLVTFGQLVIGPVWACGMLGIGGTTGGWLVVGPLGRVPLSSVVRGRPRRTAEPPAVAPNLVGTRPWMLLLLVLAAAIWARAAAVPLWHELTRTGGVLHPVPPTRPLR